MQNVQSGGGTFKRLLYPLSLRILAILLFFAVFKLLGFPFWADVIVMSAIFLFFEYLQIALLALLLIIAMVIINIANPSVSSASAFYREHEKYVRNGRYQENVNDLIKMPYGDLYAMSLPTSPERELIREPRTVKFVTDEWGFRNENGALLKSEIVLVGDSFVVGNGTSQEFSPAVVLGSISGKKIGSLGFPSDPEQYEERTKAFLGKFSGGVEVYIFYFEGNDFPSRYENLQYQNLSAAARAKNIYYELEQVFDKYLKFAHKNNNEFFRKVRSMSHLINGKFFDFSDYGEVIYREINGEMFGFHRVYMDRALHSKDLESYIFKDQGVLKRVKGVFFIPTKYRVYSPAMNILIDDNGGLEFLRRNYTPMGIPVYDLTTCLQVAAQKLITKNEYVFYRDDTHWNGNGIRAGMSCVWTSLHENDIRP